MKNTCPFHTAFQDLKINNSYKFYKIKPPVLLFAIECVTLNYHEMSYLRTLEWQISGWLLSQLKK